MQTVIIQQEGDYDPEPTEDDKERTEDDDIAIGNMQVELQTKKISELKRQALAEGFPNEHIDATDDDDDPKEALIALI